MQRNEWIFYVKFQDSRIHSYKKSRSLFNNILPYFPVLTGGPQAFNA